VLKILIVVAFCVFVQPLQAQFNFIAGYRYMYYSPASVNGYLDIHNLDVDETQTPFRRLSALHGFGTGVRYSFDHLRIELMYALSFDTRRVRARNSNNDLISQESFYTANQAIQLGLETYAGGIGIGSTVELAGFNMRYTAKGSARQEATMSGWHPASTFYLNLEVKSGEMLSVSLRPFVQVFWSELNLYTTANTLAPAVHNNPQAAGYAWRPITPGITLYLCNGRQN
jgi:hypothetical protein